MSDDYEQAVGKRKINPTTFEACLKKPVYARVLYLLELFPDGLFESDLWDLLQSPKDKTIRKALRDLEESGFINPQTKMARRLKVIDSKNPIGKDLYEIEKVELGNEVSKKRYFAKASKNFILCNKVPDFEWQMLCRATSTDDPLLCNNIKTDPELKEECESAFN